MKASSTGSTVSLKSLLIYFSSLSERGVQDFLADAQAVRGNLQKLVRIDEFKRLLQTQYLWRSQLQGFVGGGGTRIRKVLGLTYIQLNIFRFRTLADDHAGVNLLSRPDKESSALLCAEQTVGHGFSGLESDQAALLPVLDVALIRRISVERGIQDAISLRIGQKFSAVSDQAAGRN